MGLPMLIHSKNRVSSFVYGYVFACILYLSSNHFPIHPPMLLPMTWVDQAVPFIPQTVWIYITEYIFFLAVYVTARDYLNINKYAYSFLALQTTAVIIFFLWPTTFPRNQFPLDANTLDFLTHKVFSALRQMDSPNNCAPSLHVSSVYLASFVFLDEQKSKFKWFFSWATLIALSTLTTKQHYLIDVVTGLGMAGIFYYVFHKWISYRQPNL